MFDLAALVWQFLAGQSPAQYVRLASWHLLALLCALGVFSALGLHFLLGHVLRFYWRKGRLARWVAWPSLLVLLSSVLVLLGAYLLGVNSTSLVHRNLTGGVTAELGRLLLEPAFAQEPLSGLHPDEVPKGAIKDALRATSELDYRNRLRERLTAPEALAAALREGDAAGPQVLVQIGLRWVTTPHNTWFAPLRANEERTLAEQQGDDPFFLPDFLESLVDELQEGTVLPRLDWEHVAGTRFAEGVLRPLVEEYLTYLTLFVAALVLLADLLFALFMRRLKRIGVKPPAKAAPAPPKKPAAPPAAGTLAASAMGAEDSPAGPQPSTPTPEPGAKPESAADAGTPAEAPPPATQDKPPW